MFKSVKYEGFERAPELRAVCEGLTAALATSRAWPHKRIALRWLLEPVPAVPPAVELLVTDDLTGSESVRLGEPLLRDREEALATLRQLRADQLDRFIDRIIDGFDLSAPLEGVT